MTRRTVATEFPEFPAMPETAALLAAGWRDESWHNDMAPRFVSPDREFCMFVDHPDPAQREDDCDGRFTVYPMTPNGDLIDCTYTGDDWRDALAAAWVDPLPVN